jgi:hypothetical protein
LAKRRKRVLLTVNEAIEILRRRDGRVWPTAPLHSEGTHLTELDPPEICVGYVIPRGSEFAKKLCEEYEKHRNGEKSNLSRYVKDIPSFMEEVQKWFHDADDDEDEGGGDYEDNNGKLNYEGERMARGACLYEYLKLEDCPVKCFVDTEIGYEGRTREIDCIFLGELIEQGDCMEVAERIKAVGKKLSKIEIPKKFEAKELKVFISGDSTSGTASDPM